MCGGVMGRLPLVVRSGNDPPVLHDDGPDGDFSLVERGLGFLESLFEVVSQQPARPQMVPLEGLEPPADRV